MKIILTQHDVEKIVLEYVKRVHSIEGNHVRIAPYYSDYCTVEWRDVPDPTIVPLGPDEL